jgi:large subunit ribosomal protein L18
MSKQSLKGRLRRKQRIRQVISGTASRPRLNVFRSARHIYAQIIDDETGTTLASASSLGQTTPSGEAGEGTGGKAQTASQVGHALAAAAIAKKVLAVVFDRNGYRFHGRVRAVAEAARAGGLQF